MEIYTNSKASERTVFLDFPVTATSMNVHVRRDDGLLIHEVNTVTPVMSGSDVEGYSIVLPFHMLQHGQNLEVEWEISYTEDTIDAVTTRTTTVDVVEPILSKSEVRAIDSVLFASDAEYAKIEKAVRHIIQAYTGQEFGLFVGTEKIRGSDSSALFLPRRMISLDGVNGSLFPTGYEVDPSGYVLRKVGPWGVPPVKADYFGLHMHTGGVIHDPNNVRYYVWRAKGNYEITGRWGYEEVPAAVKEAAKLLVNDYACADAQYRDRYLTSMTAADWRIQFHSGAFVRTGNVRADQLLSDYVLTRGWGVI
jgi:hypothetical protein